jgi:hypothetical protein
VSEVLGEYTRAHSALGRPTLRLLNTKWAAFRVAAFRTSFSRSQRSVQADRLHIQVDGYLGIMQREGIEVPPNTSGRDLCKLWLSERWLFRDTAADGSLEYSLTSAALESLDLVQGLSRDRVLVSESRLTMILETVRRWAVEASPDTRARIDHLNTQIRELEVERDRLLEGGQVAATSNDRMLDGYANLLDLIGQLPSDFKRVEESVVEMHRKILQDVRDEDRPVAQVLDEYLQKQDDLVKSTPEGRAFDGAFVLLRDNALLQELQGNVRALLGHQAAEALDARDVAEIRGAVSAIRQGTTDVLAQRHRLSSTLRDYIVQRDVLEERELDRVLREIERELGVWMDSAGPKSLVPVELLPPTMGVANFRQRLWDPSCVTAPPALETPDPGTLEPPSIEELRLRGGPSLDRLREVLIEAFATGMNATVGDVFNTLPNELRRPVEILGILHLIARLTEVAAPTGLETYLAVRPDGLRRAFLVPSVTLTTAHAAELAGDAPDAGEQIDE